jgi:hypothetical protein
MQLFDCLDFHNVRTSKFYINEGYIDLNKVNFYDIMEKLISNNTCALVFDNDILFYIDIAITVNGGNVFQEESII